MNALQNVIVPHTRLDWQVVCDFCRQHLAANKEAYADPRLEVVNDDAAAQLEATQERFDVIVADLADPVDGGPCYQVLHYENWEY